MIIKKRKIFNAFFQGLCFGMAFFVISVLIAIMVRVFFGGAGVITPGFLLKKPIEGMTAGGIFPAIFGTICITVLMIIMAIPAGIAAAIYLTEYTGKEFLGRVIRASINNLAGVPSIVFGLFGVGFFILFVGRGVDRIMGFSLAFGQPVMLWAASTLALLVLPVIIVTTEEALNSVPVSLREAAFALGATKWQVVRNVVLPQARSGILTGAILSISRGAGETAPILFTGCAYFLPRLPVFTIPYVHIPVINPLDQFMCLSYHIFIMATQSTNIEATRPIQYGTTLVLIGLTFLLNLSVIIFRIYFGKRQR